MIVVRLRRLMDRPTVTAADERQHEADALSRIATFRAQGVLDPPLRSWHALDLAAQDARWAADRRWDADNRGLEPHAEDEAASADRDHPSQDGRAEP
jgi:hypothetical protein